MAANALTGPMCYQLGIDANQPFTVALVFQPSGDLPLQQAVDLLALFANTQGNNGLKLSMTAVPPVAPGAKVPASATPSTLMTATISLALGSAAAATAQATFDMTRRYLLLVLRDRSGAGVSVVDLDAGAYARTPVLSGAGATGGSGAENIKLSNMDMQVNASGNWNANLSAIMMYSRALGDVDVAALYAHYKAAFYQFDPAFLVLQRAQAAAAAVHACPYDPATCGSCSGVADWAVTSDAVLSAGGPACGRAIDAYCKAHPADALCTCWNPNGATYTSAGCRAYRGAFSGQAEADAAALQTLRVQQAQAQAQGQLLAQASLQQASAPSPAPASAPASASVGDLLSPSNVDAITKLVDAIRGHHSHHHRGGCDGGMSGKPGMSGMSGKPGMSGKSETPASAGRKHHDGRSWWSKLWS